MFYYRSLCGLKKLVHLRVRLTVSVWHTMCKRAYPCHSTTLLQFSLSMGPALCVELTKVSPWPASHHVAVNNLALMHQTIQTISLKTSQNSSCPIWQITIGAWLVEEWVILAIALDNIRSAAMTEDLQGLANIDAIAQILKYSLCYLKWRKHPR